MKRSLSELLIHHFAGCRHTKCESLGVSSSLIIAGSHTHTNFYSNLHTPKEESIKQTVRKTNINIVLVVTFDIIYIICQMLLARSRVINIIQGC